MVDGELATLEQLDVDDRAGIVGVELVAGALTVTGPGALRDALTSAVGMKAPALCQTGRPILRTHPDDVAQSVRMAHWYGQVIGENFAEDGTKQLKSPMEYVLEAPRALLEDEEFQDVVRHVTVGGAFAHTWVEPDAQRVLKGAKLLT